MSYTKGQKIEALGTIIVTGSGGAGYAVKPVYAFVQTADRELLNKGDKEIAKIVREVAALTKKHKKPFSEKTFQGTVYVTFIDNPPGTFDFLDVGDDGLDGKDILRSNFYSPKVTYVDNGLDGPTPGDLVFLSNGSEGNHTHPEWKNYKKRMLDARKALRQKGATPRTSCK